jgi:hypothetical protein
MWAFTAMAPPFRVIGPAIEIAAPMVIFPVFEFEPIIKPLPDVVELMSWLKVSSNEELPIIVKLPEFKAETTAELVTCAVPVTVQVLPFTVIFVNGPALWPPDEIVSVWAKEIKDRSMLQNANNERVIILKKLEQREITYLL